MPAEPGQVPAPSELWTRVYNILQVKLRVPAKTPDGILFAPGVQVVCTDWLIVSRYRNAVTLRVRIDAVDYDVYKCTQSDFRPEHIVIRTRWSRRVQYRWVPCANDSVLNVTTFMLALAKFVRSRKTHSTLIPKAAA